MPSQEEESVQRTVASFAKEVNQARRRALEAMFEFDEVEQVENIDPGAVSRAEVQKAHWDFQRSVVLYLSYLYTYLKQDDDVLLKNLNSGGEKAVSLATLLAEHGSTKTVEIECGDAMDPDRVDERKVPVLQPPNALRNAVHVLNQVGLRLGYLPAAKDRTPHDEPDEKDLRQLLEARGQSEAAERVPGGDD
ncbi:MAG: hypothetical protein ACOCUO_03240 [archaeon]